MNTLPDRLLTQAQVCALLGGISRMTLNRYRHDAAKGFPKPLAVGNRPMWRERELTAWLGARPRMLFCHRIAA